MDRAECEDKVLHHFKRNGFHISEGVNIHPSLEWQPPIRVQRVIRGRVNDAAIVVCEDPSSYKQNNDWQSLIEVRRKLPNLSIYFVIPNGIGQEPLVSELQELGIGLYLISTDGTLSRVQADRVPFEDTVISSYPIDPKFPYRNRINLYKVFNNCTGYLWWLDKHFLFGGFELLDDWCHCENDIVKITEIRILGSNMVNPSELGRLKRYFPPLKVELHHLGIQAEIKVITDPTILGSLHDRYIISDNIAFNILPVGSLIKGQTGSLFLEENPPDFAKLWSNSTVL